MQSSAQTLHERLRGLAAFLPKFACSDFRFGQWNNMQEREPGVFTIPTFELSKTAHEFVQATYDLGWILCDFDWPKWKGTPEAEQLRDNMDALPNASPEQLARLLTVLIRQERFCEGSLAGAFESGLLTAIVRRAGCLAEDIDREDRV